MYRECFITVIGNDSDPDSALGKKQTYTSNHCGGLRCWVTSPSLVPLHQIEPVGLIQSYPTCVIMTCRLFSFKYSLKGQRINSFVERHNYNQTLCKLCDKLNGHQKPRPFCYMLSSASEKGSLKIGKKSPLLFRSI